VLEELRFTWLPTRSARTHARYKAAIARLILVGLTPDQIGQAVTEAQRPNGSLNVNLLVRYADWLARQAAHHAQPHDEEAREVLS
jgi:hypothetical protein